MAAGAPARDGGATLHGRFDSTQARGMPNQPDGLADRIGRRGAASNIEGDDGSEPLSTRLAVPCVGWVREIS
jgi:hypothetical protein